MEPKETFCTIERRLRRDDRSSAIVEMARLAEALLTRSLQRSGVDIPPRAGLGDLIRTARAADLLLPEERNTLNELNELRLPMVHFKGAVAAVDFETLRRCQTSLEQWANRIGQMTPQALSDARRNAISLEPEEVSAYRAFPPLDRSAQRGELEALLTRAKRNQAPVLMLGVPGATHQGQEGFAVHVRQQLKHHDFGSKRQLHLRWPVSKIAAAIRTRELFEGVSKRLQLSPPPMDVPWDGASSPPDVWRGWLDRAREEVRRAANESGHGLILIFDILQPVAEDAQLVAACHDALLAPSVQGMPSGTLTLQFNFVFPEPAGLPLVSPRWWRHVIDRRVSHRLAGFEHVRVRNDHSRERATLVNTLSELKAIGLRDVTTYLVDEMNYEPSDAGRVAKDIVGRTHGRFSEIVRIIPAIRE